LCERIGRAARRTVEEIYGGSAWSSKIAFFLSRANDASAASSLRRTRRPRDCIRPFSYD
jgi:hypothetical protein